MSVGTRHAIARQEAQDIARGVLVVIAAWMVAGGLTLAIVAPPRTGAALVLAPVLVATGGSLLVRIAWVRRWVR